VAQPSVLEETQPQEIHKELEWRSSGAALLDGNLKAEKRRLRVEACGEVKAARMQDLVEGPCMNRKASSHVGMETRRGPQ